MKTTGVKDVPKKILLVFLGHPRGQSRDIFRGVPVKKITLYKSPHTQFGRNDNCPKKFIKSIKH